MSNTESIYEQLKSEIINLDLIPGTKIIEEDLAKKYHISRTPIRSVISRLEQEDLIVVIPKKGTYVSKINMSLVSDSMYIRKAVEITVLEQLNHSITLTQIQELKDILAEQEKIIQMEPSIDKSKKFFHNDNLFHASLFKFVGLEGVWQRIHTNATTLNRARIMANLRATTQVENIYEQHVAMLTNLQNHDIDKTINIFRSHIDGGFEGINLIIEKYRDYFI